MPNSLLDTAERYLAPPTGAESHDARRAAEQSWLSGLSATDARELWMWARSEPTRLSEADREQLADWVGQVARRVGGAGLRGELEAALSVPTLRSAAVVGLRSLGDPAALEAVLDCLSGRLVEERKLRERAESAEAAAADLQKFYGRAEFRLVAWLTGRLRGQPMLAKLTRKLWMLFRSAIPALARRVAARAAVPMSASAETSDDRTVFVKPSYDVAALLTELRTLVRRSPDASTEASPTERVVGRWSLVVGNQPNPPADGTDASTEASPTGAVCPQQPTTDDQRPTTNDQQPTTHNQQPTTNNQQPTTNDQRPIDVIVPVYRGLGETLACLRSVLRSQPLCAVPQELIFIDDGGPSSPEPALRAALRELADSGAFTLLTNEANLGFVGTCNRGMALHPQRDVCLLNADAEVFGDWLDRLRSAAYRTADVGTVTPMSNNATIASYPRFVEDNPLPTDATGAELDRLAAQANPGASVDVPTAVGFCMYIRRDCLSATGPFDIEAFGRGYGEENDFCMRAAARGYRHVLAGDVFVFHAGGVSFAESRSPAQRRAEAVLHARHPSYPDAVRRHILADPARPLRRRLDAARLRQPAKPVPTESDKAGASAASAKSGASAAPVLMVLHDTGGGTEHHAFDLADRLEAEGVSVLILQPVPPAPPDPDAPEGPLPEPTQMRLHRRRVRPTPNLVFDVPAEFPELLAVLSSLGVGRVHFHHALRLHPEVLTVAARLGVPAHWTLHDYTAICPRLFLADARGRWCTEPDEAGCNRCLARQGALATERTGPTHDITAWRKVWQTRLTAAERIFVPHADVAERVRRHFPELAGRLTVRPHPQVMVGARRTVPTTPPSADGEPLRVAVLGAVGPHKGAEVLHQCAVDAARRGLPIRFQLIGYSDRDELLRRTGVVSITGRYRESELFDRLAASGASVAFLSSTCPETWSYTLTSALAAGLYPVAFDLGAIGARIRALGWGKVLPPSAMERAAEINEELLRLRPPPAVPADLAERAAPPVYASVVRDYFGPA